MIILGLVLLCCFFLLFEKLPQYAKWVIGSIIIVPIVLYILFYVIVIGAGISSTQNNNSAQKPTGPIIIQ